jgi:hypothetical protein
LIIPTRPLSATRIANWLSHVNPADPDTLGQPILAVERAALDRLND